MKTISASLFYLLLSSPRHHSQAYLLMAKYLADRSSTTLFVNGSLDSLLPKTLVARSIWHGVEQLDMSRFNRKYRNDAEGRPAIDPRRLVAVWILAMVRGVSSSVAVADLCNRDIEMRWICGDAGPRKSCLSDFRTEHLAELADLSTQLLAAGVFVSIEQFLVEGLVKTEDLETPGGRSDRWKLHRHINRLVAEQSDASIGLGDAVMVQIVSMNDGPKPERVWM